MFQTIVVPCDLTERNRPAVDMAGKLLRPGGRVVLLHAIETMPGFTVQEEAPFYKRLELAASEHLAILGARLAEKDVDWTAEIVYGPRAKKVLEESERLEAELIILQSHRINEETGQEGFGTLSYQIAILADRPVLLVK